MICGHLAVVCGHFFAICGHLRVFGLSNSHLSVCIIGYIGLECKFKI
jgi:hypothetical protein